jgi:plastocyanin
MPRRFQRPRGAVFLAVLPVVLLLGVLTAGPAAAGGTCHQPVTDAAGTRVEMRDMCFSPTVLRVKPGDTVTFVNRDQVAHPVAGANTTWVLDETGSASARFDKAGVFAYFCHAHIGMVGVVVVGDGNAAGAAVVDAVQPDPGSAGAAAAPAATATAPGQGRTVAVIAIGALTALGGFALLRRRTSPGTTHR